MFGVELFDAFVESNGCKSVLPVIDPDRSMDPGSVIDVFVWKLDVDMDFGKPIFNPPPIANWLLTAELSTILLTLGANGSWPETVTAGSTIGISVAANPGKEETYRLEEMKWTR